VIRRTKVARAARDYAFRTAHFAEGTPSPAVLIVEDHVHNVRARYTSHNSISRIAGTHRRASARIQKRSRGSRRRLNQGSRVGSNGGSPYGPDMSLRALPSRSTAQVA